MKDRFFLSGMLFSIAIITGCKSYKYSIQEDVRENFACQKIDLINNQVLIHTALDGRPQTLKLDMGASSSVIFDTSVIQNYYLKDKSSFGGARGAANVKMKIKRLPLSISDSLFSSPNKVFTVIENGPFSKKDCDTSTYNCGLYGLDFFKKNKLTILLNFEQNEICNLKADEFAKLAENGFIEIKSDFKRQNITLYITINGIEYPFVFDTGFNGALVMPYNENLNFLNDPHISAEGFEAKTVEGITSGFTEYYEEKPVLIGTQQYSTLIMMSHSLKVKNIGMSFIKGFNWLIDFKNNKIYFKRNGTEQHAKLTKAVKYIATIVNDKIIIAVRNINFKEYKIGDEIVSVNGQIVKNENKCALLKVLNESGDWKDLKIVTKSTTDGK